MKIRGSVASLLSFIFPHPPEDENKIKINGGRFFPLGPRPPLGRGELMLFVSRLLSVDAVRQLTDLNQQVGWRSQLMASRLADFSRASEACQMSRAFHGS